MAAIGTRLYFPPAGTPSVPTYSSTSSKSCSNAPGWVESKTCERRTASCSAFSLMEAIVHLNQGCARAAEATMRRAPAALYSAVHAHQHLLERRVPAQRLEVRVVAVLARIVHALLGRLA